MSVDLDRMFATLRSDAESVPLSGPSGPRQRGTRRHRVRLGVTTLAVGSLIAGLTLSGSWLAGGGARPERVATPGTAVTFTSLERAGGFTIDGAGMADGPQSVAATVAGDRAYTTWSDGDSEKITAVSLPEGRKLWPPVDLGRGYHKLRVVYALPDAVMVTAERQANPDDPDAQQRAMFVLDPANGRVLWQIDSAHAYRFAPFESALVAASPRDGMRGLDWRTGKPKWSAAGSPSASAGWHPEVTAADLTGPDGSWTGKPESITFDGDARPVPHYAQQRLVTTDVAPDGGTTVGVYDVRTGRVESTRTVGETLQGVTVYDGTLYSTVLDGSQSWRLLAYDLGKEVPARNLHSAGVPMTADEPVPCGTARICLIVAGADESREVVAVDAAGSGQVWRRPAPDHADRLVPVGDRILVTGDGGSLLYAPDGVQLLRPEDRELPAYRITTGSILAYPREGDGELVGIAVADGSRRSLGRNVLAGSGDSSWNTRYIVSPMGHEFQVWRFAR